MTASVDEIHCCGEAMVSFIMEKQDDEVIFCCCWFTADELGDGGNEATGQKMIVIANLFNMFHCDQELCALCFGMVFTMSRVLSFLSWWDNDC